MKSISQSAWLVAGIVFWGSVILYVGICGMVLTVKNMLSFEKEFEVTPAA